MCSYFSLFNFAHSTLELADLYDSGAERLSNKITRKALPFSTIEQLKKSSSSLHFTSFFCFLLSLSYHLASVFSPFPLFVPQVFDNYAVTVMIGGEPYTLGLFDTAGKKI